MTGKELGQARPGDTNAVSIYSPPANIRTEITKIVIANTTGTAATFRIFIDSNGTTYDQTTAIAYDISLAANDSVETTGSYWMTSSSGNLAVRTGTLSALTFTAYGIEYEVLN